LGFPSRARSPRKYWQEASAAIAEQEGMEARQAAEAGRPAARGARGNEKDCGWYGNRRDSRGTRPSGHGRPRVGRPRGLLRKSQQYWTPRAWPPRGRRGCPAWSRKPQRACAVCDGHARPNTPAERQAKAMEGVSTSFGEAVSTLGAAQG
jgi:hypothetical protein